MMKSIESFDHTLFLIINAGAHPPAPLYWFAWFSAEVLVYLLAAGLAIAWLRGQPETRQSLVFACLAVIVSLLINQLIGMAWYHPRPFEIGLGHSLIAHTRETSFPSDHATVFFGVVIALLLRPGAGNLGLALVPVSLLVAWSRIWLGIHYPSDILGSLVVSGAVVVVLQRPLSRASDRLNGIGNFLFDELKERVFRL